MRQTCLKHRLPHLPPKPKHPSRAYTLSSYCWHPISSAYIGAISTMCTAQPPPYPRTPAGALSINQGPVGGVNTNSSADGFPWSSSSYSSSDSTKRGAGRLHPAYSGKLVRVDLGDFSPAGVQVRAVLCLYFAHRRTYTNRTGAGRGPRGVPHITT